MVFTDNDFRAMFFPVHGKKSIERVKNLDLVDTDCLPSDHKDRVVKYLAYMYDKDSPLPKKIVDLDARKAQALELSGARSLPSHFIENLLSLSDPRIRQVVHQMLKVQRHRMWHQLVTNEMYFYELQERMLEPIEEEQDKRDIEAIEKKNRLSEISEELDKKITRLYEQYYGDDIESIIQEDNCFTPESIADV